MKENFKFVTFKEGQEEIVSELIWKVFKEFQAPQYSEQGIKTFRKIIYPGNLLKEVKNNNMVIYCCFHSDELVGVLAVRNLNHITLLFVKKSYHKKSIAKSLLKMYIQEIKEQKPEIKELKVNSSPYAVNIYKKMGFNSTDEMQERDGIVFMPMQKTI